MDWNTLVSELQTGDIGAVEGAGLVASLQEELMVPKTKRIHHLLLGDYIEGEVDFVILESISKGTAVGRLSWYKDSDVMFYRVNSPDSKELGKRAAIQATKWGRARYDYRVFCWIIWNALKLLARQLWKEHRLRRINVTEFPALPNDKRLLCTELVKEGYEGIFLLLGEMPAFPAAYKLSLARGRLNLIGHWKGRDK